MKNHAICVLGMHRSGTSALTGVLNLLGVNLGKSLLPPEPGDNDKGFFEHADILDIHERLLAELGSSWYDVLRLPKSWWTSERVRPFRTEIIRILRRDFATCPIWAIKDPRLCRLAPLWLEILDELGCQTAFILTHRHPSEVAHSLERRNELARIKSAFLWVDHNLSAEYWTRGRKRIFVSYDQLLRDPRSTAEKITRVASHQLPSPTEGTMKQVEQFLTPNLRHHIHPEDEPVPEFGVWASLVPETFQVLTQACRGEIEKIDARFDHLRQEYDALVSSFDPLLVSHIADLQKQLNESKSNPVWRDWKLLQPFRRAKRRLKRFAGGTARR
ncbi:MAG: hypothetical protein FVQ81_17490 [Candidatus Glassbacteria bacterium]|nr:hypothetical protein [Candidatus Glassbacteria bacterium]